MELPAASESNWPLLPLHQLCKLCSDIRFDLNTIRKEWEIGHTEPFNHHRSLVLLKRSSSSCHLCTLFLSCIRIRIDPHRVDNDWVATSKFADDPISLAYRKKKSNGNAEIEVKYGSVSYVVLKLAEVSQPRCNQLPTTTVCQEETGGQVLGCITSELHSNNRKLLYSAVANRHSDSIDLESFDEEDLPDLSEFDTFFAYVPGWVCNVFEDRNGFCLVAWVRSNDPDHLAWIPSKCLTPLLNSPHKDCSCGKGVWEQPLIAELQTEYLNEDPASDAIIAQIKLWISYCQRHHTDCQVEHPVKLPDRVLDVGPEDGSQEPFLSIGQGRHGDFVSLSYRWGLTNGLIATVANLESLAKGIPLHSLPRTLQDAVVVTRKLGYRYLWIDALCIVQDSREDWLKQSVKMAQIYGEAVLNIQADCARDNGDGFLQKRSLCEIRSCEHPNLLGDGVLMAICPGIQFPNRAVQYGSLSSRGWILQERALSKRIVHWTAQEVLWECWSLQATERRPGCYQWTDALNFGDLLPGDTIEGWVASRGMRRTKYDGIRIAVNRNTVKMLSPRAQEQPPGKDQPVVDYASWYDLVDDYSSRELTNAEDKLIAISSLAKTFKEQNDLQDSYLSGLWSGDIVSGLIWTRLVEGVIDSDELSQLTHLSQLKDMAKYRAPSFSWASVDARVDFPEDAWMDVDHHELALRLVDCFMRAAFEDQYSAVSGGYIQLQGYAIRYLDLPSKREKQTISETEAEKTESHSVLDQNGDWSSELDWVPNLLALLLRSRYKPSTKRKRSDGDDDNVGIVSEATNVSDTATGRKKSYESYWLILHPTEKAGVYYRAGLHIEKQSIEVILGELEGLMVTVV